MIRVGAHHLGQPCSRPLPTPQHSREAGPLHPPAPHRPGPPPRPARLDGWGNPKTAVASERHGPATLALPAPSGPAPTMAAARLCGGCCESAAPAPPPAGAGRLYPVSRTTPPATPPSSYARRPPSVASIPPAQSDHFSVVTRMPAATDTVLYREQPASGFVCPMASQGGTG